MKYVCICLCTCMHIYIHMLILTRVFHKPLLFNRQAAFWLTLFFPVVFNADILICSFSSKELCINKYFKSTPLFSQFLKLQSSFAYQILINDWSLVSLLKNL